MERKDPLTGEEFYPKRSNQFLASRENQTRFNNLKASKKRKVKYLVDSILDKNRKVLAKILGDELEIIKSKEFLRGAEFHFGCHTHSVDVDGTIWRC